MAGTQKKGGGKKGGGPKKGSAKKSPSLTRRSEDSFGGVTVEGAKHIGPRGRHGPGKKKQAARGDGANDALGGARPMTVRVKSARGRKRSSTLWLQRQLNDPYVAAAQQAGWRSRAAFKLIELNDKFDFLRKGQRIVDLGAAPGGWTQVAVKSSDAGKPGGGQVVGLDILEMEEVPGATVIQQDFTTDDAPAKLKALLGGPVDVVISDMAAPTTGHKETDHMRIMYLCELALDFARQTLAPGGGLLVKVFQGGAQTDLLNQMKASFDVVKHAKPPASRSGSSEAYVWCSGFRGNDPEQ